MVRKDLISRYVALALTGVASTVMAQQAPAPALAEQELQEIVVTGSMIRRPNAETTEAVTIVKAETLKDMGITTVEQALSQLTSNVSGVTTQSSVASFSGGASFASLRGLGGSKTLVLLDGERLANNVVFGSAVDLNTIPFSAIDHIEVLREGASSLYGSDAIAGVINFITKKDYDKGEISVQFSHPQQNGDGTGDAELSWGKGNLAADGYNLMITANYTKTDELRATQRSFSATGLDPAATLANLNGPMGTWPGSFQPLSASGVPNGNIYQMGYPACTGNPFLTRIQGNCQYEFSAAVDLIPKSNVASGLIDFTKSLPGNNTLSVQFFVSRFQTTVWAGPQTYSFLMYPASDPAYYPTAANSTPEYGAPAITQADLANGIVAGWTDPNNNRYQGDTNTESRFLVTFAGQNGGWDYATSFDYSINRNTQDTLGGEANYTLLAPGGTLSNLINPFGAYSAAGQGLINSAYRSGNYASGYLDLYSLNGHASHELGDAFGAGRPAVFAIGVDARIEQIKFASNALAEELYTALYYPPNAITGSRQSQAIYSELNVPVTKEFEFTVSDRQDRYSDFGDTNNAKLALRYQPFSNLTFRGTASTGFRAPSLVDLYAPDVFGADAGTMNGPPCPAGGGAIFTASNCAAQGMSLSGGNANLKPETSQNIDLGLIVEPITDLGITIDYYHVLLKNEIQALPDVTIYANPTTFADLYVLNNQGTLTQAPQANTSCPAPLGHFAPTCGYIIQTTQNTGSIVTSGVDLSANYLIKTDMGKFRVGLEGTAITQYLLQEYPGGPELNLVGEWNQGNQPIPRWQHMLTLDWTEGNWGAGLSNRLTSRYIVEFPNALGQNIESGTYSVFNGYVSVKPIAPLTVLAGIRNIFDKTPGFDNQYQNWQAGYNPLYADPTMRAFYVQLKYEF
jgi:iron complex outermembrane recepter protein